MEKHTQGNWSASKYSQDWGVYSETGDGRDIALVREYQPEAAEANAKLIAAAPDLLKALGDIMLKLNEHQNTESKILAGYTLAANIDGLTELLNSAQSAYCKATQ